MVAMAKHGGLAPCLDLLCSSLSCVMSDAYIAALLLQVCNYPFTTRSIKMGHFYIDANRHQVWLAGKMRTTSEQLTWVHGQPLRH